MFFTSSIFAEKNHLQPPRADALASIHQPKSSHQLVSFNHLYPFVSKSMCYYNPPDSVSLIPKGIHYMNNFVQPFVSVSISSWPTWLITLGSPWPRRKCPSRWGSTRVLAHPRPGSRYPRPWSRNHSRPPPPWSCSRSDGSPTISAPEAVAWLRA